ncbi:MAG: hypothetical protein WB919_23245 [Candidatus Sulfotelmatobacter sp.]
MAKLRLTFSLFALAAVASLALSCGASPPRTLQSVTLSPATADSQDYPDGQVQFTVSGHYNTAPETVTPQAATWGVCYQNASTNEISVTTSGMAQCASGAAGTYTVWANDPIQTPGTYSCPAQTACGGGCTLQANAQLICH